MLQWATPAPEATPTTPVLVSAEALILLENATHLTRPIMIMGVMQTTREAGMIHIEGVATIPIMEVMVARMMMAGHVRGRDIIRSRIPMEGRGVERIRITICQADSRWYPRV